MPARDEPAADAPGRARPGIRSCPVIGLAVIPLPLRTVGAGRRRGLHSNGVMPCLSALPCCSQSWLSECYLSRDPMGGAKGAQPQDMRMGCLKT